MYLFHSSSTCLFIFHHIFLYANSFLWCQSYSVSSRPGSSVLHPPNSLSYIMDGNILHRSVPVRPPLIHNTRDASSYCDIHHAVQQFVNTARLTPSTGCTASPELLSRLSLSPPHITYTSPTCPAAPLHQFLLG